MTLWPPRWGAPVPPSWSRWPPLDAVTPTGPGRPNWTMFYLPLLILFLITTTAAGEGDQLWSFTSPRYNVSVAENALALTSLVAGDSMMVGMFVVDPSVFVRYRITGGDEGGFFKASARVVGDFCFLDLAVRHGHRHVLNRESREVFRLKVKAQSRLADRTRVDLLGQPTTEVWVTIVDLNDLSPFFLHSEYRAKIGEDTPLYASVLKVKAEDPDAGLNGEIYYSIQEPIETFVMHPSSGVLSLARSLRVSERANYELTVVARDRGPQRRGGGWSATAKVLVNVTAENAWDPQIVVTQLVDGGVPRTGSQLSVVAIVNVIDADRGPSGKVNALEVVDGDPGRVFQILPGSSGNEFHLSVVDRVDWQQMPFGFNLTLKAVDGGARPRSSYRAIHIPRPLGEPEVFFLNELFAVNVSEWAPVGAFVVQVASGLPGSQFLISYSITAGNEGGSFVLEKYSGVLSVAAPLDAELLDTFVLTVAASIMSPSRSSKPRQLTAKVNIRVLDENDHTPLLVAPQGSVRVEENQPAGTWVTRVRALDPDQGENSHMSYSLVNSESVPFGVDPFTGDVHTARALDYESEQSVWQLLVRASDWGAPLRRQSEKIIMVHVADVNDNRPQFERVDCRVHMHRTAPTSTEVMTLSAIDFDIGSIISYRIVDGNDDRCFALDPTTGVMTLACDLSDYGTSQRTLNVTASDGQHFADTMSVIVQFVNHQKGTREAWVSSDCRDVNVAQRLTQQLQRMKNNNRKLELASQQLIPSVVTANLNYPKIILNETEITVLENMDPGSVLLQVFATDLDAGYGGILVYAISSGNTDGVFRMNETSGEIVVAGILDYESVPVYKLNITVSDLGSPSLSSWLLLTVILIDDNDHDPHFDQPSYQIFLLEDQKVGVAVFELHAEDPDLGTNGVVSYSMSTKGSPFDLNELSGRLILARPLDFEDRQVHELRLVATDGGGRFTSVTLTVQVVDVNDCPPELPLDSPLSSRVPEDWPVGALVGVISALDRDSPRLQYTLLPESMSADTATHAPFRVDELTGSVRLVSPLDYETRPAYNLSVRVTDDGVPALSVNTYFVVQVLDVDENAHTPTFDEVVLETCVSEDVPAHTLVASAHARDADPGRDGAVTYTLVGEAAAMGLFYVDQKGDVYTSRRLDRETRTRYWLSIRAQDSAVVPRHATLHMFVCLEDANDHRPLSEWPIYWPAIIENSPPGTPVGMVTGYDRDADAQLQYSITAGNPQSLFTINPRTGELQTTERRLDREKQSEHVLEVTISDGDDSFSLSSTTFVVVTVLDENDHDPTFLEKRYKFSVPISVPFIIGDGNTTAGERKIGEPNFVFNQDESSTLIGQTKTTWALETNESMDYFLPYSGEGKDEKEMKEETEGMEEGSGTTIEEGSADEISNLETVVENVTDSVNILKHKKKLHKKKKGKGKKRGKKKKKHKKGKKSTRQRRDNKKEINLVPLCRVIAFDPDDGVNGLITYSIGENKWRNWLEIDSHTGIISSRADLDPQEDYELKVIATDSGDPRRSSSTLVLLTLVSVMTSDHPPTILEPEAHVTVLENDPIGHSVKLVEAIDEDGDQLWFDIVEGNIGAAFAIGRDSGNIIVSGKLDAEKTSYFDLTVQVTDGVHQATGQVRISVLDVNDNWPSFSQPIYELSVSEHTPPGSTLLTLLASDPDSDRYLAFLLVNTEHEATVGKFRVTPLTGEVVLNEPLDREVLSKHTLTVGVKDRIAPTKSSYARVIVNVLDHNDHVPQFSSTEYRGMVSESAALGTSVLQVHASDHDRGVNGMVSYAIVSGNTGSTFYLDPESGEISLSRSVNFYEMPEYWISVRASDAGSPSRHSYVNVNVIVGVSHNSAPRFRQNEYLFDIDESARVGEYVGALEVESHVGVFFSLLPSGKRIPFAILPGSGVIIVDRLLDFEEQHIVNFTVLVSSMNGKEAVTSVVINILDMNDNAPYFLQHVYTGHVSEASVLNSVILTNNFTPLVVVARDKDSGSNANLLYTIVETDANKYFSIDSTTGAIRTNGPLDYEKQPLVTFTVNVQDRGVPSLSAIKVAYVVINVTDVNDVPPRFSQHVYNASIYVPTYRDVFVVQVHAFDPDFEGHSFLTFALADGNREGAFIIDTKSGRITVNNSSYITKEYQLKVIVNDGHFESSATVNVKVLPLLESSLGFSEKRYFATIEENLAKPLRLTMVHVVGAELNEPLHFSILNIMDEFVIGETSGVLQTTGKPFDREEKENYILIVQVESIAKNGSYRAAQTQVHVVVADLNDNTPMFVDTPYYAVVPVEAKRGHTVFRVRAVDSDADENGLVRYELRQGNGELFSLSRSTGEISLRKKLDSLDVEHELLVWAYDGGSPQLSVQTSVRLRLVDKTQPLFSQQSYVVTAAEDSPARTPLLTMKAHSQLDHRIIYTIVAGNDQQQFAMEYEQGILSIEDELDFESQKLHLLSVRATDCFSGKYTEVPVRVDIQDANDHSPIFESVFYSVNISELSAIGSSVITVHATDKDLGINAEVVYSLSKANGTAVEIFFIDGATGIVSVKRPLDREFCSVYYLIVKATDRGTTTLSSMTNLIILVNDVNDNAPKFLHSFVSSTISEGVSQGHFVAAVTAADADASDENRLIYSIVDGNEFQTFTINSSSGHVTVWNAQRLSFLSLVTLNISVTDGVFTSFIGANITIGTSNKHSPSFANSEYIFHVPEDILPDSPIGQVAAIDLDKGAHGIVTYQLVGDRNRQLFSINTLTGIISTSMPFDFEKQSNFDFMVMASDPGGRSSFASVQIMLEDVNDNDPQFLLLKHATVVAANATKGSVVLQVIAEDIDAGENGTVRYRFFNATDTNLSAMFILDEHNGEITLLQDAKDLEQRLYQFFVEAHDMGSESRHVSTAIQIFINKEEINVPKFMQKYYSFSLYENVTTGTVVGNVMVHFDGAVDYAISWHSFDLSPPLTILSNGTLVLNSLLVRRQNHRLNFVATATPKEHPQLAVSAMIEIILTDVNDNDPIFDSDRYFINAAENTPIGTPLMKVGALDRDEGANAELHYVLAEMKPSLQESLFAMDSHSGWISLNRPLDAEIQSTFELQVVAYDSGIPSRSGFASVHIEVLDINDNPHEFTKVVHEVSVAEDSEPGSLIVKLELIDLDLNYITGISENSTLYYFITDGSFRHMFAVRPEGHVYLVGNLDREEVAQYDLEIVATDGVFIAKTRLLVKVTDVNDNPPLCTVPLYQHSISESSPPGTFLLKVTATDADVSTKLKYKLSGLSSELFSIDSDTGKLSVLRPLDREKRQRHSLIVIAIDGTHEGWNCSMVVEIEVTDVNDNAPMFSLKSYSINVLENGPENLLLTKIHAGDPDKGVNRRVTYSLEGSDTFAIDRLTGVVSVTQSLDREKQSIYNITVVATDSGTPQISAKTNVLVIVSDVNDNPPQFASHTYYTTVPESCTVGSDIVRVLATSRDSGKNAEITYSVIGGNEHRKFHIHPKTGVVSVLELLDFERVTTYLLTVQATDGGEPPLSNHATVNVTVTDINDYTPVFMQSSYSAAISEASIIGDRLIQVVATDLDSAANGDIVYSISGGDPKTHFRINEKSGWISVAVPLDREMLPLYNMEVICVDNGIPQRSGSVAVNVEVLDANDNPPEFVGANHTAVIQDDKAINTEVFRFKVRDVDTESNGPPFTFEIRSGNEDTWFRITQSGELRTARQLSHKLTPLHRLQVRVYDNGRPPLFADTLMTVKVIEESKSPPVVFPLQVSVVVPTNEYYGGILGTIKAEDEDPYDTLQYSLVAGPSSLGGSSLKYFAIHPQTGALTAKGSLDEGYYSVNVSVSDGKFSSLGLVQVEVVDVGEAMVAGSVVIRLGGVAVDEFVVSYRRSFVRAVKNLMEVKSRDVVLVSLQAVKERKELKDGKMKERKVRYARNLRDSFEKETRKKIRPKTTKKDMTEIDVLFAVRKSEREFIPRNVLRKTLMADQHALEAAIGLSVVSVIESQCTLDTCVNGECQERLSLDEERVTLSTATLSFVSQRHSYASVCVCPAGFAGPRCDVIVSRCAHRPCPAPMVCIADQTDRGYHCRCPEGFLGPTCTTKTSDCTDRTPSPFCFVPMRSVSLGGKSFLQLELTNPSEKHLSFSVWFRTLYSSGTLMFMSGKLDYNILEVVGGIIHYRWQLGSGDRLLAVPFPVVSDGQWHHVALERFGNSAQLVVDGKYKSQGVSPGTDELLDTGDATIYLGAEIVVGKVGEFEPRRGLVGCMDEPRIEGSLLYPPMPSNGVLVATLTREVDITNHCQSLMMIYPGLCGSYPCLNGGTCEDRDDRSSFVCLCSRRYMGKQCEWDRDPCSSSPCLNNGLCIPGNNTYICQCPIPTSGSRCQHLFCQPNPCLNGGACEESLTGGAMCKCRGFTGTHCSVDVDECQPRSPCLHGGTCVNTYGSFRCVCPSNATGVFCDVALGASIFDGIGFMEVVYIVIGVIFLLILALTIILCMHCRDKKSARSRHREEQSNHVILNPKNSERPGSYKRNSKMINLELCQSAHGCSSRSDSFPIGISDSGRVALNNFDDKTRVNEEQPLDAFPGYSRDFVQNILKPAINHRHSLTYPTTPPAGIALTSLGPISSPGSEEPAGSHKHWKDSLALNLKDAYVDNGKIQNDLKFRHSDYIGLKKVTADRCDASRLEVLETSLDDIPEYHWDCSDWAQPTQNPLSNITEVSGGELLDCSRDSSSVNSNESNESATLKPLLVQPKVTSQLPIVNIREMATLPEEVPESDIDVDSDLDSHQLSVCPLAVDEESESEASLFIPRPQKYKSHPNQYLPNYVTDMDDEKGKLLNVMECKSPKRNGNVNGIKPHLTTRISDGEVSVGGDGGFEKICDLETEETRL